MSKVALSICALMTATVLARAYAHGTTEEISDELAGVLESFSQSAAACLGAGAEVACSWTVPILPTGGEVVFRVSDGLASASGGGQVEHLAILMDVHLWEWQGGVMNDSLIEDLDLTEPPIEARSGAVVELSSVWVLCDIGAELMLFAAVTTAH